MDDIITLKKEHF